MLLNLLVSANRVDKLILFTYFNELNKIFQRGTLFSWGKVLVDKLWARGGKLAAILFIHSLSTSSTEGSQQDCVFLVYGDIVFLKLGDLPASM